MKTGKLILSLLLSLQLTVVLEAQPCVNPMQTLSYDTLFSGSGNAFNVLSFPKFDASLGTLLEVKVEANITLLYSFELENRELITINNYRVRVTREDEIGSTALQNSLTSSQTRTYGPYPLTAWDGVVGSGTDYTARGPLFVLNHYNYSNTVYNTADYLGSGNVEFDYMTTTYSSVLGSVNYTFNATATDTVSFRITYTYCPSMFLKADLLSFQAVKKSEEQALLYWSAGNEESGRRYEIQSSTDGRSYQTIGTVFSHPDGLQRADYQYPCSLTPYRNSRVVLFRLRQVEKDGTIKYSSLQAINLQTVQGKEMRLYPNPASAFVQISTGSAQAGNWQVELYSVQGQKYRTQNFRNIRTILLQDLDRLPSGMYLIRLVNTDNHSTQQKTLIIK